METSYILPFPLKLVPRHATVGQVTPFRWSLDDAHAHKALSAKQQPPAVLWFRSLLLSFGLNDGSRPNEPYVVVGGFLFRGLELGYVQIRARSPSLQGKCCVHRNGSIDYEIVGKSCATTSLGSCNVEIKMKKKPISRSSAIRKASLGFGQLLEACLMPNWC